MAKKYKFNITQFKKSTFIHLGNSGWDLQLTSKYQKYIKYETFKFIF